jgi:hypothetical protein
MADKTIGRGQFRMIIESGIQRRKISELLSEQCVTGLIEPPITTTLSLDLKETERDCNMKGK